MNKNAAKKKTPAKRPVLQVVKDTPAVPASVYPHRKILVIAHNHPELYPGGGEKLAYQLYRSLKESGHTAHFLAATGKIMRAAHPGTPFLSLDGRKDEFLFFNDQFDYFMMSNRDLSFLYRDFANFLKEHRPEIVHFHHLLRFGAEALRVVRDTLPEALIVFTLHDFLPMCHRDGQMVRTVGNALCDTVTPQGCNGCFQEKSTARFKTRELFLKTHFDLVDLFISPSRFLADRYIAWGLPQEKMHVVPNGTEAATPAPHRAIAEGEKRNRFGFFGQVSPFKGTLLLTEAAERLKQSGECDFGIHIHGNIELQNDAYKKEFTEKTASLAAEIRFHGIYASAALPQLMREVDYVIVPSIWWENAPLVIAEAFRHRRPVICSNIGGMAELVKDGINGLHFRVGDSQSLADVMRSAMQPDLWEKLAAGITPPPTIDHCAEQHLALFNASFGNKSESAKAEFSEYESLIALINS